MMAGRSRPSTMMAGRSRPQLQSAVEEEGVHVRYLLREKILSWGDDFTITDTDGHKAFHIDGRVFSFGDKLSFKDRDGNEAALIDQKLLSLGPAGRNHPRREGRRGREEAPVFTVARPVHGGCTGTGRPRGEGEYPRSRTHVRACGYDVARSARSGRVWPTPTRSTSTRERTTSDLASAVVIDLVSDPIRRATERCAS